MSKDPKPELEVTGVSLLEAPYRALSLTLPKAIVANVGTIADGVRDVRVMLDALIGMPATRDAIGALLAQALKLRDEMRELRILHRNRSTSLGVLGLAVASAAAAKAPSPFNVVAFLAIAIPAAVLAYVWRNRADHLEEHEKDMDALIKDLRDWMHSQPPGDPEVVLQAAAAVERGAWTPVRVRLVAGDEEVEAIGLRDTADGSIVSPRSAKK